MIISWVGPQRVKKDVKCCQNLCSRAQGRRTRSHELVALPLDGKNVLSLRRILLQLSPQHQDVGIYGPGSWKSFVAPYFVQEVVASHNVAPAFDQELQDV